MFYKRIFIMIIFALITIAGCTGTLTVTSDPSGAEVYQTELYEKNPELYEKKMLGYTPLKRSIALIGPVKVKWADGSWSKQKGGYGNLFWTKDHYYHFIKKKVNNSTLNKSINTDIKQKSKKQTETQYGYVKLTSDKSQVDIFIDGSLVGQIQNKPFNKKLPEGEHTIMAKKEFYVPYTININLDANSVLPYHFKLQSAESWIEDKPGTGQIVQAKGNLTVVTERSDLEVYVEGVKKIPPFELKEVPAGRYDLRIVGPGIDKHIKVTVNNEETIFVDLDKRL